LPTDPKYLTQPRLDENNYIGLPLGDRNDPFSWHTLSYDTLGMDYPKTGDRYFIQYRAKHAAIPLQPADTDAIEIRMPEVLEKALLASAASTIYGQMSMESALAKSKLNADIYEVECVQFENRNAFRS